MIIWPLAGPSGMGSVLSRSGRSSSARVRPARVLKTRARLLTRSPTLLHVVGRELEPGGALHEVGGVLEQEGRDRGVEHEDAHRGAVADGRAGVLVPHRELALALDGEAVDGVGERQPEDLLDGVALVVVGAGEGGGVAEAVCLGAAHVVGRQLEALDVQGVLLRALADLARRRPGSRRPAGRPGLRARPSCAAARPWPRGCRSSGPGRRCRRG